MERSRTENEKAAVAGRVWEPGQKCAVTATYLGRCISCGTLRKFDKFDEGEHIIDAPDMHLPENLWRALENQEGQWCRSCIKCARARWRRIYGKAANQQFNVEFDF